MKNSVPVTLLIQTGSVLFGVAVGSWLLITTLIPQLGLGQVERIRQLGLHIQARERALAEKNREPLVVLLGDSITREGIDAERLENAWHELSESSRRTTRTHETSIRFENWAISGCSLAEQRIQLSQVLQAKPEIVVFALGPSSLCRLPDLPLDKAYAYAYAGFEVSNEVIESLGISTGAANALCSQRWQQQLHFRSAPKSWLNEHLRTTLKGGGRNVDRDWTTPYMMNGSVASRQLEWHVDLIKSWWTPERSQQVRAGAKLLTEMVQITRAAGARPVLVAVPIHPQLAEAAQPLWDDSWLALQSAVDKQDAVVIDARAALDEHRFADALHPNDKGRDRYSQFLASELQQPILTARK